MAKKAVAIGFIAMVLLGNYWLVYVVTGREAPWWLYDLFYICAAWILLSGAMMGVCGLKDKLSSEDGGEDG